MGVLEHFKQISHLASKSFPGGLFCNFSRYVKLSGGSSFDGFTFLNFIIGNKSLTSITQLCIIKPESLYSCVI